MKKKIPFLRNYIEAEEMRITEYRLYKLQLNYYLSFIFMTLARKMAFLDSKTDNLTNRQAQHNYMTDKLYLQTINSYQQHPSVVLSIFYQVLQEEYILLSGN